MAESKKPSTAAGDETAPAMRIDPSLVRELAELLTENELTEIEVQDGERRVKVRRELTTLVGPAAPAAIPMSAPPQWAHVSPGEPGEAAPEEVSGETIKSPMVGTAYLSAQPGAKPFVEVGDAVKAGDTLLIVEAMKVMNPITAPAGGIVKKLLVSDGQPVEFDQPLAIIG
jgi:acetyl-CoA carboxylase biotin carboxyl carrier protein